MINARYVRYSSTTCLSRFTHNDHRASSTLKLNILWLHAFRVCKHIIDDRSRDRSKFILPRFLTLQNQQSRSIRGIESEGVRRIRNIERKKKDYGIGYVQLCKKKRGEVKHMAYNITNFSCHFPDFLHKMTCFFFLKSFLLSGNIISLQFFIYPLHTPPPLKLGEGDSFKFPFLFLYLNIK